MVICSELANNPGPSVTEALETIPGKVIKHHNLSGPVWIEHYPPEATNGRTETFELVAFSSYKVREILRGGSRRYKIGKPSWKPLDRKTVEALIGQRDDGLRRKVPKLEPIGRADRGSALYRPCWH